jgi:hypothetical protein
VVVSHQAWVSSSSEGEVSVGLLHPVKSKKSRKKEGRRLRIGKRFYLR